MDGVMTSNKTALTHIHISYPSLLSAKKMQGEEERRRKMFIAVETVTSVVAKSADAVLAAIAEQKEMMMRERQDVAPVIPTGAVEEMGIQETKVRAVAHAVVSRENSEEILEQEVSEPSASGPSSRKHPLMEEDNSKQTKKIRMEPKA